ncbi:MAG: TIGR03761 family integrating conjugative element protein [Betaproteobacteria bacterium]|nr:TIGR03761 family integrating conjugative element protein [Betaproteobacteria bacterium]
MEERVQSGSDRVTLNIGSLRSQINLELHTYHAARLWAGRRPSATDNKLQGVLGLTGYLHLTTQIKNAAAQDDPYADWMMIQIEEKIEKVKTRYAEIKSQVKEIIDDIPRQLTISENLNLQPARMPLYVNTPLGFQGVYLLIEFDGIARDLLLANHIGKMMRGQMEDMLDQAAHQIRSTFAMVQNYRNTGVTRDDIAANNPRARDVVEKYGLPPQDVLEGTRRSSFAPAIIKKTGVVPVDQEVVVGKDPDDVAVTEEMNTAAIAGAEKPARKKRAVKEVTV